MAKSNKPQQHFSLGDAEELARRIASHPELLRTYLRNALDNAGYKNVPVSQAPDENEVVETLRLAHTQRYGEFVFVAAAVMYGKPTAQDLGFVCDLLRDEKKPKLGRRREYDYYMRLAVKRVKLIKRELREQGKKYRIHDLAVEQALESMACEGLRVPPRGKLENTLKRSRKRKSRANSG